MSDAEGGATGPTGRWVSVRLQRRQVWVDEPACADDCTGDCPVDPGLTMSYDGIAISNYADGELVSERWIPLGAEPSEEDDEVLIEQLRAAMLWQSHPPPQSTTGD
ncbi:hypothetical protein [Amycolatopsis sp. FDAARGOS 1241]|uniref:hypothetical protein n=1 Tax=Amycolatopsis sp. FDAARGOS 1241 TaxID=2778070 RepID=UPI00194E90E2|nr:hypothetical protein [Amycolatopsis sp. FDAARGOS 1241]QRP44640.1 hypothetical protein I6J71_36175 [Amycolatopsis sp. FDAARGOS 1241]